MNTVTKIFCIIFLMTTIFSCSDDYVNNNSPGTPSDNFVYPTKLNTLWYYTTRNFLTNLRGDSVHFYFTGDTTVGYGAAKIERDTVLNGDTLRLLRNSHSDPLHSHTTLEFYKQTDSGLIRVAFYSDGANFGPYRPSGNSLIYSLNGKNFTSLNDILQYSFPENNKDDTTLIFDNPPIRVIKYPVSGNSEWEFVSYSGNPRITKKYTDYEEVTTTAGSFHCIKIQRNWYYNSPNPDTKFRSFDYFSEKGMIKRDFVIKDVVIQNQNQDTLGIIDVKEEAELNIIIQP